jgi:ribonuclease-3 family protein
MDKVLSVAYLGDAVYELYIRNFLIGLNIYNPGDLQKKSLDYVSARSQRKHLECLINNNLLTEEELDIIRKGRNAKGTKCKSTDIITYRIATGLEYLFGVLYLRKDIKRIEEIISLIVGE